MLPGVFKAKSRATASLVSQGGVVCFRSVFRISAA